MIVTKVYRISRTELAWLASEEYLRSFWWFVASVPAFGIIAVIFGDGALRMIGAMAILWPFSIPARSVVSTAKSSRLFRGGCHVEADEHEITFLGEYFDGKRLRFKVETFKIKEAKRKKGMILMRTRIPGFLPIREEAFESEEDIQNFIALIAKANEIVEDTP